MSEHLPSVVQRFLHNCVCVGGTDLHSRVDSRPKIQLGKQERKTACRNDSLKLWPAACCVCFVAGESKDIFC